MIGVARRGRKKKVRRAATTDGVSTLRRLLDHARLGRTALPVAWIALSSVVSAQGGWEWPWNATFEPQDAAADKRFGSPISSAGDTVLVAAPRDDHAGTSSGAAYVFVRSGTSWIQQAKLTASDAAAGQIFGGSISLDGNTALVGGWDTDGAYVFSRTGSAWSQRQKLASATPGTQEGLSVSVSGDTAAVGALFELIGGIPAGAVYVYVDDGSTWTLQAQLTGTQATWAMFGYTIALDGDTMAILQGGAERRVYVFARAGSTWTKQQEIDHPAAAAVQFGESLALVGDTLLVGAPTDDPQGVSFAGSVYVYARSGSTWSQQAVLTEEQPTEFAHFGGAVALDGDLAIAGSSNGPMTVFVREGTNWEKEGELPWARSAVALSGNTAFVGDSHFSGSAGASSGAVHVHSRIAVAGTTFRSAGTNPASYDAVTLPVLGTTYTGTIDLGATTGHSLAWLVGYVTPLTLALGGGQTILVNVADPTGELLTQAMLPGPIATYNLPVPSDIALVAFTLSTQGLHIGGVQPFALSNAQDLFLGY